MEITFYGHACFGITFDEYYLLFDPFISPNEKASHIDINAIKPTHILLSHGHGDHIADAEAIAKASDAMIIANYEVATWFENKGVRKTHPMNHGGSWAFAFGKVKAVNAIHSSMLPDGSYGGNPMGFVIEAGGKTFYYAGDTALTLDMKLIAERFVIDFAILPLGSNFTMDYIDAMTAAKFVGTKDVIGMHFDTFGFIEIDHEATLLEAKKQGIDLLLPEIGQTFTR
jgi:L-ascorbate metabolism protein UlaG (beta-lactamase superfamily)